MNSIIRAVAIGMATVGVAGALAVSTAPAAHAEYACWYNQGRDMTYNGSCSRGDRHFVNAYYDSAWHYRKGNLAYSFQNSGVGTCYVRVSSYGTIVY